MKFTTTASKSGGFDWVGDSENSRRLAIYGDEYCGLAFFLEFDRCGVQRLQSSSLFVSQEIRLADRHHAAADGACDTAAGHRAKVLHGVESDASLLRAPHDSGCQGVFATLLQRCRQMQELVGVEAGEGKDIHKFGLTLCEGASLVHDKSGDFF